MKKLFAFKIIALILGCLFVLFVVFFGNWVEKDMQAAVEEHARVVSSSLWNLNQNSQSEYLSIVARYYNYETITIVDHDGGVFSTASAPTPNLYKRILLSLKLIPRVKLTAPIIYDGEKIGSVVAIWHCDTIYAYSYLLFVLFLVLIVSCFYNRLLQNNLLLENKVAERTKHLTDEITERKQTEAKLHFTQFAVDHTSDAAFWINSEGGFDYVNDAACRSLGYSHEELLTMSVNDVDPNFPTTAWPSHWEEVKKKGSFLFETNHQTKDGRIYPVEVVVNFMRFQNKEYNCAFVRDISDRKAMESQLQQAHKMEAIGTLAGGIAHDFNNILSAILGYAEIAREDLPEASQSVKDIDQVITAGKRATELVKQILTFSRKTDQQKKPLRIDLIVNEALKLIRSSLPTTIDIHTSIEKEGRLVLADPTSIHQVVINLCTNASQAIGNEKGKLEVLLEYTHLQPEQIADNPEVQAGPFLLLTVKDSGIGMDKKTVERIFEPYFTTKKQGEGTGLGLAVIHGIVEDCNGMIKVESTPGKGTAFHVFLPTVTEKQPTITEKKDTSQLPTGNERILYIDDEPDITHVGKSILTRFGYNVTTATNSMEALKTFHETPEAFDLVITDQTMPGLTGGELAQAMLELRPELPIILCTGFTSAISKDEAYALGIKKYVTKPFGKEKLVKTVKYLLDESELSTV